MNPHITVISAVDDDPYIRECLEKRIFRDKKTFNIKTFSDYQGLIEGFTENINIAIIDVSINGSDANFLPTLKFLNKEYPGCKYIILSGRLTVPLMKSVESLSFGCVEKTVDDTWEKEIKSKVEELMPLFQIKLQALSLRPHE